MDTNTGAVIAVGVAYLIGSIPFGLLLARLAQGIDIRKYGSGNIGATNVARVVGPKWGVSVLILDALKGAVSAWLFPRVLGPEPSLHAVPSLHVSVACGIAAVVGHMFPCYLKFRGGKGVATALGVVVVLAPLASAVALGVFLVLAVSTRYIALASMTGAVTFGVVEFVREWPRVVESDGWSLGVFSAAVPLLIIFRHRSNIGRLLRGEEPKFRTPRHGEPPAAADSK